MVGGWGVAYSIIGIVVNRAPVEGSGSEAEAGTGVGSTNHIVPCSEDPSRAGGPPPTLPPTGWVGVWEGLRPPCRGSRHRKGGGMSWCFSVDVYSPAWWWGWGGGVPLEDFALGGAG